MTRAAGRSSWSWREFLFVWECSLAGGAFTYGVLHVLWLM